MTNEKFAEKVADNYLKGSGDRQAVVDPAALTQMIIAIIQALTPLINSCLEARKARIAAGKPTPIQKALVAHKVRQVAGNSVDRAAMTQALLKSFAEVSDDDAESLVALNS